MIILFVYAILGTVWGRCNLRIENERNETKISKDIGRHNAGFNKLIWMWKDGKEVAVNGYSMLRSRMLDILSKERDKPLSTLKLGF